MGGLKHIWDWPTSVWSSRESAIALWRVNGRIDLAPYDLVVSVADLPKADLTRLKQLPPDARWNRAAVTPMASRVAMRVSRPSEPIVHFLVSSSPCKLISHKHSDGTFFRAVPGIHDVAL